MRAEYLAEDTATPAKLGLKYGMDRWRARYVLDRDPSVISQRVAKQQEQANSKIAKLRALVLPPRQSKKWPWGEDFSPLRTVGEAAAAKAMGFNNINEFLNWIVSERNAGNEEMKAICSEWEARRHFLRDRVNFILPDDLPWETYRDAWTKFAPQIPVWRSGQLTPGEATCVW